MRKLRQNQYFYLMLPILAIIFQANVCLAEFTIEDERKVGKEFFDKLEEHELLLKNKVLNDYITEIGTLVLAQTSRTPFDFKFSIVDSSAINAFATPGGYIYINKGLIMAAESEAQLAGVIAHEIGHANARHVASIIQKSKRMNIAAMAAVLAGLFLGGGGETTAAIAAFSMAGASTMTLRYMRQHEEEADRMGIEYLVRAGYCPTAMIDFLKIMKQHEFLSKTMPSYMQTHPGTDDRIFYIESLILTRFPPNNVKNIIGNFSRIQDRVPLNTSELGRRYRKLEEAIKKEPENLDLLYSLATVEDKLGQTASALEHFQKALTMSPRDYDILRNIGSIYLKTGETDLAKKYLHRALNLNPNHPEIILTLGRTYFASGEYEKALESYLRIKDADIEDTDIHYLLAMAYGRMHNKGDSHYHFGLHFKNATRHESALFHFKEALNYFPKNSDRATDINREIQELADRPAKRPTRNPRR
jgi:predicted Zn-dependent protease